MRHSIVAPYTTNFVNSIEIDKYRHQRVVICFHPHGVLVHALVPNTVSFTSMTSPIWSHPWRYPIFTVSATCRATVPLVIKKLTK